MFISFSHTLISGAEVEVDTDMNNPDLDVGLLNYCIDGTPTITDENGVEIDYSSLSEVEQYAIEEHASQHCCDISEEYYNE